MLNRRFIYALVGMFFAAAVAAAQPGATRPGATPVNVAGYKEAIKVACIGDSITAGYKIGKGQAWPAQLSAMLGDKWSVSNFGVSGKTLMKTGESYQATAQFKSALELKPDVVLIMLGTNDTKPRLWARKDDFEPDYKDMIKQFAALPSKPIMYLCYPPFVAGQNQYGIREEPILEQIQIIDKIAAEMKLNVIDVHGALRDKGSLVPDKVHPGPEGAAAIARTIYAALTGKAAPEVAPAASEPAKKSRKNKKEAGA
jgi:lysophospholipase L1-like esterase